MNAMDEDMRTPLMNAVEEGHSDVAALLVQSGARTDFKVIKGVPTISKGSHVDSSLVEVCRLGA